MRRRFFDVAGDIMDQQKPAGFDEEAFTTGVLQLLVETSTTADRSASNLSDVMRSTEMLAEQAQTVERVFSAVRTLFETLAQKHGALAESLSPEQFAELQATLDDLRAKFGLAAGALRRWNLQSDACAATSRQASTSMTDVRMAIMYATSAAEQLLV